MVSPAVDALIAEASESRVSVFRGPDGSLRTVADETGRRWDVAPQVQLSTERMAYIIPDFDK